MNQELVMDRAIMIALIGIGLYAFFALVDLVKTKRGNKWKENILMIKDIVIASMSQQVMD